MASPPTTLSPKPKLASMIILEVSPVLGSAVNKTPAERAFTILTTATPMGSLSSDTPTRFLADKDLGLNVLDQTFIIFSIKLILQSRSDRFGTARDDLQPRPIVSKQPPLRHCNVRTVPDNTTRSPRSSPKATLLTTQCFAA